MRRSRDIAGKAKEAGIGPQLLWSAAGHLLFLLAILSLHPGNPAFPLPGVVEVLLVPAPERPAGNRSPAPIPVRREKASETGGVRPRGRTVGRAVLPPAVAGGPDAGANTPAPAAVPPPRPAEAVPAGEPAAPVPATDDPVLSPLAGRGTAEREVPPGAGADGTEDGGSGSVTGESQTSGSADAAPEAGGRSAAVLRARIQERIVYPAEAVRRGQEGEVLLRVRIGIGGVPREIRVARSSGARILDEAARRGVVRAAPLPSDPGWIEIPVRFSLR